MASTAQQQLGNEGGRFELLRKTFGGAARPGYGQGQQRLDQMLLGQGGGLGKVQSDVAGQSRDLQAQAKDANSQKNEVGRLAQQEKDLMSGINTQTGANEQSYLDMLNSYVDPLNQQRSTEVQNVGKALGSYNKPYDPTNPGLNADQMSKFGLTDNNQGVYNVFKGQPYADPTGATDEEKRINAVNYAGRVGRKVNTDGTGYLDVANDADVNRYSALTKMLGQNAMTPRLTEASKLESAFGAKTDGTDGLKEQLASAQKAYDATAADTKFSVGTTMSNNGHKLSASANDLLNKGRDSLSFNSGIGRAPTLTQNINAWVPKSQDEINYKNSIIKNDAPRLLKKYQEFLDQQNYNRTLGGRRETFLDSENPNKLSNVPITGYDPSNAGTK